jgi:hypothetical protein
MSVEELPFGGKNSSKSGLYFVNGKFQEMLVTASKIGLVVAHILKILVIFYAPIW